jgi:hypothetical protein
LLVVARFVHALATIASANQTPSSTSGTNPVTKTYPGTTTMQVIDRLAPIRVGLR